MEVRGQGEGADDAGRAFAEAVAVDLAQRQELSILPVPQLREIAARTSSQLAGQAAHLGAGRIVTGSLTRDGRKVRASVSLVDVMRNRIVWGTETDSDDGDIARLASATARDVGARLGAGDRPSYEYFRYVTGSPGMAGWPDLPATVAALTRHDYREGLRLTARLVAAFPRDPNAYVMRYVALTDAYTTRTSKESPTRWRSGRERSKAWIAITRTLRSSTPSFFSSPARTEKPSPYSRR